MGPLAELIAAGRQQVLEFFVAGLRDVSETSVNPQQLFYNASVLAHHAQTSTVADDEWPTPATLSTLLDHFVLNTDMRDDGSMMETAGAQCLLLSGFFQDQMQRRHNIRWYAQLGAGFFARAAHQQSSEPKARLLTTLAQEFEPWRQRHARLGRELRLQPYLLQLPKAS